MIPSVAQPRTANNPQARELPLLEGIDVVPPAELFGGRPPNEQAFGGALGLRKGPAFTADELGRIRDLVKAKLIYSARNLTASAGDLEDVELENYHLVSDRLDHSKMLCKTGRILGESAVDEIKSMSFFRYVREAFGDFYLSDEDNIGHEQICMRLVRPHRTEDVGSLHRDAWFWEYYKWPVPAGRRTRRPR